MPSIDVAIPCYNYGNFLAECVKSALEQDSVNVRVQIIDDASPDCTAEVAAELAEHDSRVSWVRHASNKGHIATYNEGIEWASADYFLLLSADDLLLPGALGRACSSMDRVPEAGLAFGGVLELRNGVTSQRRAPVRFAAGAMYRILAGEEFIRLGGARNIVATATAVVRTDLQKAVGGYRESLPHAGDMEMWWRLAAHASVVAINEYQAVYRCHDQSMSAGYYARQSLPDLLQRKEAIDLFLAECGGRMRDVQDLRKELMASLSADALGWASSAFNDGEDELCDELVRLALSSAPLAKWSWPWVRLSVKRGLGRNVWGVVRSVAARTEKSSRARL